MRNRQHRSAIAQFRCGILPLKIETGRYMNIPVEFRLCNFCDNCTETEVHFLLYCPKYSEIRSEFNNVTNLYDRIPNFENLNDNEKLRERYLCQKSLL